MAKHGLFCIVPLWFVLCFSFISAIRLQRPGEPPTGCAQGSEVMGGPYANLPPCPPWVDQEGNCRIGDTILTEQQCLDIMPIADYLKLPRGRPNRVSDISELPPPPPPPQQLNDFGDIGSPGSNQGSHNSHVTHPGSNSFRDPSGYDGYGNAPGTNGGSSPIVGLHDPTGQVHRPHLLDERPEARRPLNYFGRPPGQNSFNGGGQRYSSQGQSPGTIGGGFPPGGWPESRAPSSYDANYAPPGFNIGRSYDENEILPPGPRNARRFGSRNLRSHRSRRIGSLSRHRTYRRLTNGRRRY